MSGGHFDYVQQQLGDVYREIDRVVEKNPYDFRPEVIVRMREAALVTRMAEIMIERVDYLICGDDGEESFLHRWMEELTKLTQEEKRNRSEEVLND